MKFLLDTNILVHLVRQTPSLYPVLDALQISRVDNQIFISIISVGEIMAFSKIHKWGFAKRQHLDHILGLFVVVPIVESPENATRMTDVYATIDAYSQGKYETKSLPKGMSARNMGKNDLWIAATAQILNATLLTTDKDFEHLNDVFLNVVTIEI
jgi:tRNA(fMet)-specific endonuclease VapC